MHAPGRIRPIRRIVTGHDTAGRSTILQDGPSPHAMNMAGIDGFGVTDVWKTFGAPAELASDADPCGSPITLAPPRNGTVFRIVEFPPDAAYLDTWDPHAAFA